MLDGGVDDGAVASMDAVKIADRIDCAFEGFGQIVGIAQYIHKDLPSKDRLYIELYMQSPTLYSREQAGKLAMSVIRTCFVLVLMLLFGERVEASSGRGVMQEVFDQSRQHKDQLAEVKLVILDKTGRERVRYFRYLYKIFSDRTKSLIKFYQPPSVRGTGLLNEAENGAVQTEQWIYLPALKAVKKLSTNDKHKSFMGSDFTNADISGRQVDQDRHEMKKDDGKIIIIVSTPKDKNEPYGRIETHILKKYNVPRRVIFYDHQGVKLKTLENQVVKEVKGMFTVMKAVMVNHRTDGKSRIQKENFSVSTRIDANEVGFKGLKR